MMPATMRSGHAVPVAHTPLAAKITARLPTASLRLQSQTETDIRMPVTEFQQEQDTREVGYEGKNPSAPMTSACGMPRTKA